MAGYCPERISLDEKNCIDSEKEYSLDLFLFGTLDLEVHCRLRALARTGLGAIRVGNQPNPPSARYSNGVGLFKDPHRIFFPRPAQVCG
jgi:hypothetical protein